MKKKILHEAIMQSLKTSLRHIQNGIIEIF